MALAAAIESEVGWRAEVARDGVQVVVDETEAGTFGNQHRDSSLEVVASIAEQRQILRGADHAFLWKPKLRIPDIYERPESQRDR